MQDITTDSNSGSAEGQDARPAGRAATKLKAWLRLLRPKQWTKNLIAYAPVLFAMQLHNPSIIWRVTECVIAFCCLSSSIYIYNDIMDREADRQHPTKCKRPIAAGLINIGPAVAAALILAATGMLIGFFVRPVLCLVFGTYLALMLLYGKVLKHKVLLDVIAIAAGFVLRALGGAIAAGVPSSGWFLACTSFGALFLGIEKRRQELRTLKDDASAHRKTLDDYSLDLIDRLESLVVPCLLTCYTFWSFQSFHGQWMMLTVPFVVYGVMRYQVLSVQTQATGTPEEVLLKDRPIQAAILLWLVTAAAVAYNLIPAAADFLVHWLDTLYI